MTTTYLSMKDYSALAGELAHRDNFRLVTRLLSVHDQHDRQNAVRIGVGEKFNIWAETVKADA